MNVDHFFMAPKQSTRLQSAFSDFNSFLNKKSSVESPNQTKDTASQPLTRSDELNGKQVFAKSIEYSMGLKVDSVYEFKVPSPQDVANTVLGFVEKRISAEKNSGASTERLNDLMAQARKGVEQGYAQAEKDIKALGMMTEELQQDINAGFQKIGQGMDKLQNDIDPTITASILSSEDVLPISEKQNDLAKEGQSQLKNNLNVPVASSNALNEQVGISRYQSLKQITENSADFVLKTREGDKVLFSFSDIQKLAFEAENGSTNLGLQESSRYLFSVEGDLNQDELAAINYLLDQVYELSDLFFSERFEEAFTAALGLGFDGSQIAAFSLDLRQVQVQEVRVYEQGSKQTFDAIKRNQPLINAVKEFETLGLLLEPLERFESPKVFVQDLLTREIDRLDALLNEQSKDEKLFTNSLNEFANSLLQNL